MCHTDLKTLRSLLEKCSYDQEDTDEIRRQMDICCGLGLSKEATELYDEFINGLYDEFIK
jgi:hypothetical protein